MATPSSYTAEAIEVHGGPLSGTSYPVPSALNELQELLRRISASGGTATFVPSEYTAEVA